MKNSFFFSAIFVLLALSISSFTQLPIDYLELKYYIKGVERDFEDGLKPSEFAELTIETANQNITITAFQITLARGDRAVEESNVETNKFNLKKFASKARSGDRIVIEVKKLSDQSYSLNPVTSVIAIRVS